MVEGRGGEGRGRRAHLDSNGLLQLEHTLSRLLAPGLQTLPLLHRSTQLRMQGLVLLGGGR